MAGSQTCTDNNAVIGMLLLFADVIARCSLVPLHPHIAVLECVCGPDSAMLLAGEQGHHSLAPRFQCRQAGLDLCCLSCTVQHYVADRAFLTLGHTEL